VIVASDAGGLGSTFLTVCQREYGLVFSTTVFQSAWVAFWIACRSVFLILW